jgi:hypothetical protein
MRQQTIERQRRKATAELFASLKRASLAIQHADRAKEKLFELTLRETAEVKNRNRSQPDGQ